MKSARGIVRSALFALFVLFLLHWSLEIGNWKLEIPPVRAAVGTLDLKASTASYSGTFTQAGNQPIRTAFGPLRLDYKSGSDTWTTGLLMREGDGNISIGANITSADFYSTSKLRVLGIVESTTGGFKFPDGTTQTSAASGNVSGWTDGGTNVYLTTGTDNVGIGTTAPGAKLEVAGNINSSTGALQTAGVTRVDNSGVGTFAAGTTIGGSAVSGVPAGLIGFFASACPTGWTEYTSSRGRVIVGVPLSGTVAGTVGTALTDLQNPTHTHTGPSHTHTVSPNAPEYQDGNNAYPSTVGIYGGTSTSASGTGATSATSATPPYIQLTACQKS